jgi:serine protease Do
MMRGIGLWLLASLCMWVGPAAAESSDQRPAISVARITSSIQEGQPWGMATEGLFCITNPTYLDWNIGIGKLNVRAFEAPARAELKREGFPVSGDPTDPFADKTTADLALGGTITALRGEFCVAGNAFDPTAVKGSARVDVDWQLYSTIERKTVSRASMTGSAKFDVSKQGGFQNILIAALNDSLRKFTATDEFAKLTAVKLPSIGPQPEVKNKDTIKLAGSTAATSVKISDAVGAVVLILSGDGHGSGFLVSSDGYVLTAQHVVGTDKYVKVRWSDGLESVGEVIRSDRRRDAALIKADPRGRTPLALRREKPEPGDTVFAIGAPIDPKLQNTVTRGVVSANNRIIDGFSFIQSDVTVDPGNSGGPLLDDKGQVLGFTDLGMRTAEAPTGLNFFVPIDDALRFLSAEPQ